MAENTIEKTEREAQLEQEIKELKALLAAAAKSAGPTYITAPTTDVAIVYTSDCKGVITYSRGELLCTRFGEEFVLDRASFDEIVGKYRKWFDEGILAVASRFIEVAAAKGLPTDKEYNLTVEKLGKLGKMSSSQIESLWNSIKQPGLKDSIVYYFKRKFMEGDTDYQDRMRIDTVNRLSDGKLSAEIDQLSGRNYIAPTDLNGGKKETIKVLD